MCPWKLGQGHQNIKKKKLFKLSQWYAQTTTYWFIRYHAFTQEREWGEWYANTNIVADKIRTKICPTSSWVGGEQKSSLCLKTNQAKCSSLKEWQKKGSAMFDKMLEYIFPYCAQNYCVSSSHIHVYDLLWFMSPFLVKCLVNGEIHQLGGFIPIASQLQLLKLLENMVNCSLDNLEIIISII